MTQPNSLRIGLGSTAASKYEACQSAVSARITDFQIIPVAVDSGVSDQPVGIEELTAGAETRAVAALEQSAGAIGIGIEAGVISCADTMDSVLAHVILLTDGNGFWWATSPLLPLPTRLVERTQSGEELGTILRDQYDRDPETGTIAYLTNDWVDRVDSIQIGVRAVLGQWERQSRSDHTN